METRGRKSRVEEEGGWLVPMYGSFWVQGYVGLLFVFLPECKHRLA